MPKPNQIGVTQESQKPRPKTSVTTPEATNFAAAFVPEDLLNGSTSFNAQAVALQRLDLPQQQQLMRQINQVHGNNHIQRLVGVLQRQDETAEATDEPLDPTGLGIEERELPGHADQGGQKLIQRAPPVAGPAAPPPAPTTTATINLIVNPPNIDNTQTAAQISANHGRANVAGWTTPTYDIAVPNLTANTITVDVTLDFTIELASEYTGGSLEVLSDHEQAHVIIGERVARQHLVTDLRNNLQGMATFRGSNPQIQAHLTAAANSFVATEAADSQTYDTADYPRMREAYYGVRTPLSDLEAGSAPIAALTSAFFTFTQIVSAANDSSYDPQIQGAAEAVMAARTGLSDTDLHRLQYNEAFRAIVADCNHVVDHALSLLVPESEAAKAVTRLRQKLADFTWVPTP